MTSFKNQNIFTKDLTLHKLKCSEKIYISREDLDPIDTQYLKTCDSKDNLLEESRYKIFVEPFMNNNAELVKYCDKIIEFTSFVNIVNKIKSKASFKIGLFYGKTVPSITVSNYCERLRKYFNCSNSVYPIALIYMDRYSNVSNIEINQLTIHRLLLTSMVIAVKYCDDNIFSNEFYSNVGGIELKELNSLENNMVNSMQWDLKITTDDFVKFFYKMATSKTYQPKSNKRKTCYAENLD